MATRDTCIYGSRTSMVIPILKACLYTSRDACIYTCVVWSNGFIAALVDQLIAKTKSWEEERKKVFLYDEVRYSIFPKFVFEVIFFHIIIFWNLQHLRVSKALNHSNMKFTNDINKECPSWSCLIVICLWNLYYQHVLGISRSNYYVAPRNNILDYSLKYQIEVASPVTKYH